MPKISVIVPVYNVENYLHRCVDSILNQTFTDFELILVDDGSTDNSGNICEEYAKKDNRVVVIHQKNSGVSAARNAGIDIAKGEYISFIDSDDWIEKNYLDILWEQRTDLTLFLHTMYDENNNLLSKSVYEYQEYNNRESIDFINLCNKMFSPYCRIFRNDIIQNHNLRFSCELTWGEDAVFGAMYSRYINNAKILEYSGYHYIRYGKETSLSTKVRYDIVDMITNSRESYLKYIILNVDKNEEKITEIIENDICYNCSYFLKKLFTIKSMTLVEKNKILKHFLDNKYIKITIKNHLKFYEDYNIIKSIHYHNPFIAYYILTLKSKIILKLKTIIKPFFNKKINYKNYFRKK